MKSKEANIFTACLSITSTVENLIFSLVNFPRMYVIYFSYYALPNPDKSQTITYSRTDLPCNEINAMRKPELLPRAT